MAGSGLDDLAPFKALIGDARIVALVEATHGTREFFQMKHRLTEFLASEMGFTIFSIEANMPEAYRVNGFILRGQGDPGTVLLHRRQAVIAPVIRVVGFEFHGLPIMAQRPSGIAFFTSNPHEIVVVRITGLVRQGGRQMPSSLCRFSALQLQFAQATLYFLGDVGGQTRRARKPME